jgi:hypothetical protein
MPPSMAIETVVVPPASGTAPAAGAVHAEAADAGAVGADAVGTGAVGADAVGTGAVDAGVVDTGAVETGAVDAGAADAGAADAEANAETAGTTAVVSRRADAPLAIDAGMDGGDGLPACSLNGVANGESSSTEAECSTRSTRGNPGGTCVRFERHFHAVNETSARAPPIKLHRVPRDSEGSAASAVSADASDTSGVFAAEAGSADAASAICWRFCRVAC